MNTSRTILIAALSLVLTGCVSKKQYAELQTTHNALKDKYASLDKDYQEAKVQIATFTSDSKSLAARLAEEQQLVFILIEIAVVRQGKEGVAHGVGIGDVFKEPQAIQIIVSDLLVVGQDVDTGKPQARDEPLEFRHGLAGFLGLNVDHVGAVH